MAESRPQKAPLAGQVEALLAGETEVERMFAAVIDLFAGTMGAAAFFIREGEILRGWRMSDGSAHRDISDWSIPPQSGSLYKRLLNFKSFLAAPADFKKRPAEFSALKGGETLSEWPPAIFGDGTGEIFCVPWRLGVALGGLFLLIRRTADKRPTAELMSAFGEVAELLEKNVLRLYNRERPRAGEPHPAPQEAASAAQPSRPPDRGVKKSGVTVLIRLLPKLVALSGENVVALGDLKRMAASDSSLTTRIIKLASSPYYSNGVEAANLDEALLLLGFEAFRGAMLAAHLRNVFLAGESTLPSAVGQRMWRHALACASIARILATHATDAECENAFAAGLFHDIGRVMFCRQSPEGFVRWLHEYSTSDGSVLAGEREIFGEDHAQAGAKWAAENGLPESIVKAVANHHSAESGSKPSPLAEIVEFADVVCRYNQIGLTYRHGVRPDQHTSWHRLNLPAEILQEVEKDLPLILAAEALCL